ncbi:MAG: type restriction-modification methylase subunit [Moraxellaceae bacterium]|jgi:type I restriction enzyme S subunit|nr:type restriction-modification methylase subunit [Moraxellaceae bacterium]
MSQYKPYPAYKDSGVEWLGRVPEHWQVAPFKWHIDRNDGGVWGEDPDGANDTIVLRSTEQTVDGNWRLDDPASRRITAAERDSALLLSGDLLLTKSSGSSAHIGKTTLVTPEIEALRCGYSNFMQRIRTKASFSPKLAWYLMNNDLARRQFELLSNTTTGLANLNGTMVGQVLVAIPPADEQVEILSKLDREAARIDALVEKKTRFIELLREKRQALITHAVTKGLDPKAKMKDSGVEWLGEVPEHWRVSRLRHNIDGPLSYGANEAAESDEPNDPRFIRITDLNEDGSLREDTFKSLPHEAAKPYLLRDGDVLLARSGATVGKSFIYRESMGLACYAGYLIRARMIPSRLISQYFWLCTQSTYYWDFISGTNIQATIQNVSGEKYANLWLAVPPLDEQKGIIEFLERTCAGIDAVVSKTERSIELLKERRSALITAAVTGQIDLRESA